MSVVVVLFVCLPACQIVTDCVSVASPCMFEEFVNLIWLFGQLGEGVFLLFLLCFTLLFKATPYTVCV